LYQKGVSTAEPVPQSHEVVCKHQTCNGLGVKESVDVKKKAWGNDDGMCHPTMGFLQHGMCHDKIKWRIPKLTMKTKRSALIYKLKNI